MKVPFTAKEYQRLLELVHLGMWVVTAYQGEDTAAAKRYFELDQRLLELATDMGCAPFVETRDDGTLQPAPKLSEDEKIRDIQNDFTNDVFWHELVARLAERDADAEQTRTTVATPGIEPPPAPDEVVKKVEERYWDEFEKHDLAHVVVLRGGQG